MPRLKRPGMMKIDRGPDPDDCDFVAFVRLKLRLRGRSRLLRLFGLEVFWGFGSTRPSSLCRVGRR